MTFEDFSPGEVFEALRQVSEAIQNQTYQPYETLSVLAPKGDGRFRELSLQRITDRTVAKSLQLALNTFWRRRLPGIGRDVYRIYAKMQRVMRERNHYVLAIDDIENCFPSARIEDVFNSHRRFIGQPELLWLIDRILRGHDGPQRTIGLDQGSPYSPVGMELLLHTRFDEVINTPRRGYPLLLRYVDNLTFVCNNEREGHEILYRAKAILSELEMNLKGTDGDPQDIRDPKFNTSVLGLIPRWQDGQLKFTIPEASFKNLEQGLIKSMEYPNPTLISRSVVTGWMEAIGPAFTNTTSREIMDQALNITRRCGFREFSLAEIREAASCGRTRWMKLSRSVG